jgi:hypothetical protein
MPNPPPIQRLPQNTAPIVAAPAAVEAEEVVDDLGEEDLDEVIEIEVEDEVPGQGGKRRRVTRKYTFFCQNNRGDFNEMLDAIQKMNDKAIARAKVMRDKNTNFWNKAVGLDNQTSSEIRLLMWAVSCGISRNALNDPLFDSYLKSLGKSPAANRHTLQSQALPVLDSLVGTSWQNDLKGVLCVSISSDGWRDQLRRNWINLVVQWCESAKSDPSKWAIYVVEPDLIPLSTSATAEALAYLLSGVLEKFVRISAFGYEC